MRSKWKQVIILNTGINNISNSSHVNLNESFLNDRINVYNGKKYLSMVVKDYMLKKNLSNFVISKFTGKNIHIKKKKRKSK